MQRSSSVGRQGSAITFSASCAVLIGFSLIAGAAQAQSAAGAREQARKLAAQGYDALKRKDYAAAEALFRTADGLVHAPTLGVDQARALVGLGKLVEGHERYAQVLRDGVPANAPWQWHMAVVDAEAELTAVDRRLVWLTITVKPAKSSVVEIDGKAVPDAALGVRRATNPGLRVVTVEAEGYLPLRRELALSEGQAAELELTLEPRPSAKSAPAEPTKPPKVVIAPSRPQLAGHDRTLPVVLLSAGGALLVAGGISGIWALNERSGLRSACGGGVCAPTTDSEYTAFRERRDKYRALGTASGVALAVGTGAALTGLGLLLFTGGPPSSERVTHETRVTQPSLQVTSGSFYFGLTHLF